MSLLTDFEALLGSIPGDVQTVSWTSHDSVLYSLAVGAGSADPTRELEFTTDNTSVAQRALPTLGAARAASVGVPALLRAVEGRLDPATMLHGDQWHRQFVELGPAGTATAPSRITAIADKGTATVVTGETDLVGEDGTVLSTTGYSMFFRGVGGWGGDRGAAARRTAVDGDPEIRIEERTRPDQPLLYRLTGDSNPLHTDPAVARSAGFPGPIMHGMCVYGIVGRRLLERLADGDPGRFRFLSARFAAPVAPGDALSIEVWPGTGAASFRVLGPSGAPVLSDGVFESTPAGALSAPVSTDQASSEEYS